MRTISGQSNTALVHARHPLSSPPEASSGHCAHLEAAPQRHGSRPSREICCQPGQVSRVSQCCVEQDDEWTEAPRWGGFEASMRSSSFALPPINSRHLCGNFGKDCNIISFYEGLKVRIPSWVEFNTAFCKFSYPVSDRLKKHESVV